MQQWNRSPINTGNWQKGEVGVIGVPQDWCDSAQDLLFCRILCEDAYPVDVDKLSKESHNEAHKILNMSMKEFDFSKAAIHTVSIRMLQALFSSTNNQAHGSPNSCQSTLH